jgi:hypothetical protein
MRNTNLILERPQHSGVQKLYRFDNGYGASVVRHGFSYGGTEGLWELAVIQYRNESEDFFLVYDTPITSDVIGDLTEDDVDDLLNKIEDLENV